MVLVEKSSEVTEKDVTTTEAISAIDIGSTEIEVTHTEVTEKEVTEKEVPIIEAKNTDETIIQTDDVTVATTNAVKNAVLNAVTNPETNSGTNAGKNVGTNAVTNALSNALTHASTNASAETIISTISPETTFEVNNTIETEIPVAMESKNSPVILHESTSQIDKTQHEITVSVDDLSDFGIDAIENDGSSSGQIEDGGVEQATVSNKPTVITLESRIVGDKTHATENSGNGVVEISEIEENSVDLEHSAENGNFSLIPENDVASTTESAVEVSVDVTNTTVLTTSISVVVASSSGASSSEVSSSILSKTDAPVSAPIETTTHEMISGSTIINDLNSDSKEKTEIQANPEKKKDYFGMAMQNYKSAVCYRSKAEKLAREVESLRAELKLLQEKCN